MPAPNNPTWSKGKSKIEHTAPVLKPWWANGKSVLIWSLAELELLLLRIRLRTSYLWVASFMRRGR